MIGVVPGGAALASSADEEDPSFTSALFVGRVVLRLAPSHSGSVVFEVVTNDRLPSGAARSGSRSPD